MIAQRNALPGKFQKLNVEIQIQLVPFFLGKPEHARVWFQRVDLVHSSAIVMSKIDAGTYADLEDSPLRFWDNLLSYFPNRFGIA